MKCRICKDEEASWAWQPFGPGETPNEYALLGSHTRGFPVIKVGDVCKNAFQTADFEVQFEYKGHHYIGKNHEVKEVHVSLWKEEGTISPTDLNPAQASMIMKETPDNGSDLVALVFDADLVQPFLVAPRLLEACQELDKMYAMIARHLDFIHVPTADRNTILMALSKMHVAMSTN